MSTENKFAKMLSASNADIKATRAGLIAEATSDEVDSFVAAIKKEKRGLEIKLNNMTDLAADNSYSLRPGSKDFEATKWVKELHQTKMDIKLKTIELEVAEDIRKEWFGVEATA